MAPGTERLHRFVQRQDEVIDRIASLRASGLPINVARAQAWWEHNRAIYEMRESGQSWDAISDHFVLPSQLLQERHAEYVRDREAEPLERYRADPTCFDDPPPPVPRPRKPSKPRPARRVMSKDEIAAYIARRDAALARWRDIVPDEVAERQVAYERDATVYRMKSVGMTFLAIAERIGLSPHRVRQLFLRQEGRVERGALSPVEEYLNESDLPALAASIRSRRWAQRPTPPPSRKSLTRGERDAIKALSSICKVKTLDEAKAIAAGFIADFYAVHPQRRT